LRCKDSQEYYVVKTLELASEKPTVKPGQFKIQGTKKNKLFKLLRTSKIQIVFKN
jgi:hypothetical protein